MNPNRLMAYFSVRFPRAMGALLFALAWQGADAADDRVIRFPDVPGFRTLKGDFHQHTVFSDGRVWPNVRVDEAVRDGLDAMAITDHLEWQPHGADLPHPDRNRSFEIAQQAASLPPGMSEGDYWLLEQRRKGREDLLRAQDILPVRPVGAEDEATGQDLLVLNGVEITRHMPLGHVNALFLKDANRLLNPDPVAVLREAAAQDAFVVWNHPWSPQRTGVDGIARLTDLQRQMFGQGLVHGIEIVNTDTYSAEALQIALDHNLTIMGNSDIHSLIEWVYPARRKHRPVTLVFAKEKTAASLKEALRERRTVVWFNNTLIGREEWVAPLVRASLQIRRTGFKPDRRKFSIQDRPDTSLLDVELVNSSDAAFILRNVGEYKFATEADVMTIPAHGSLRVTILALKRNAPVSLEFEVLNCVTAPGRHPTIAWKLATE